MTRYYSICELNQSFRSPRLPSEYTSRVELTSSSIYSKNIFRASSISTKLSTRSSYGPFRIGRVTGSRGEVLSLQRLFQGKNRELSSTVVFLGDCAAYPAERLPVHSALWPVCLPGQGEMARQAPCAAAGSSGVEDELSASS